MRLKTKILYLVSLAAFLRSFAQVIYVPSLATLRTDLNTTTAMVGLTLSVYGLFLAFSQIAYGPIIDRSNAKRVLLVGMTIFAMGNLTGFFTRSIELLLLARALQALGIAAAAGVGIALITDVFPSAERGRAMSIFSMFNSAGAAAGPAIGGFLAVTLSWRVDFLALALVAGALILITVWQLPPQPVHGQRVGPSDMLAIARTPATFGALMLGLTQFYGLYTVHTLTPILLTERLGLHEGGIGAVATALPIGVIIGQWLGGRTADSRGLRFALILGGFGTAVTFGVLTFVSSILAVGMSPLLVASAVMAFGLTAGFGFPSQLNIMVEYFTEIRGTAGALQFFARFIGTTIGPVLVGFLADELGLTAGYGSATLVLAAGALIAFFTISNPVPVAEMAAD